MERKRQIFIISLVLLSGSLLFGLLKVLILESSKEPLVVRQDSAIIK